MTKYLSRVKHTDFKKIALSVVVIAIVAIGGTYLLLSSHAASPYVAVTADSGTLSDSAQKQTCTGASDGSCVAFGGSAITKSTDCFPTPGACGYPDPAYKNVGVSDCSALTASGAVEASTNGQTVQNLNISGGIDVSANNVTIKNDCVSVDGGDNYDTSGAAISVEGSGVTIENSTIGGANNTTQATQAAIDNTGGGAVTANADLIQNCSECIHGSLTLNNSYVATTTANVTGSYGLDHYEDWYVSDGTASANHDTMFNSMDQTAVIFGDTNGGYGGAADNHITLTDSLIGGGGYVLYPYGNSSSVGSGTMNISNNRFTNAYYPNGGSYGIDAYIYCGANSGQVWSGNVWDSSNQTVSC